MDARASEKRTGIRMNHRVLSILAYALCFGLVQSQARAFDASDARMLSSPAITDGKIAFVYAGDIWVSDLEGKNPKRVTSYPGDEASPFFSPDGRHIAFTGGYDGNNDVYVIPVDGGEPTRLTWHPGNDVVRGFTPSGDVLFISQRAVFSGRHSQFFTVGVTGGVPKPLPVPTGFKGAISPNGKLLAYTPGGESFRQWKNYRGGTSTRIWVLKLDDLSYEEIPKPSGGCNDTEPMWIGDSIYFLSDRDGEFNLYAYETNSKRVSRCTTHEEFPVASASAGAGKVIYEQAGWIHLYEPETKQSKRLKIAVAADLVETRPRYASDVKYVRDADISPTGKRVVVEYRGEIVTLPAKKGDPRNLTQTPGANDRSPVWSPDGKSIAYFSDASGEYELVVRPQDGLGEGKSFKISGSGFYDRPNWAPDSGKLAFIDNSRTLYWIDVASGAVKKIGSEAIYSPINTLSFSWSPDSRWLAYTLTNRVGYQAVWLYSLESGKSHPLTDGLVEAGQPAFDAGGKFIYFVASTDSGPVKNWFDQSFTDMQATSSVYLITLAKATANPFLKESDEEGAAEPEKGKDDKPIASATESKKEESKKEEARDVKAAEVKEKDKPKPVVIDLDGITQRVVPLPIPAGAIENLSAGSEGQLYFIRRTGMSSTPGPAGRGKPALKRFDLKTREEETLAEGVDGFKLSADHKKTLYRSGGAGAGPIAMGLADAGKFAKGDGSLDLGAISVRVEPRAESAQILKEAWRINRDYFYATNMHGADWPAVKAKYEAFLPDLATRDDLNKVIRMMLSELSVGHSYLGGGERLHEPKPVPVGLLGADFDVAQGRFRFKTIFGGSFWDPNLKAPLTAPGVDVKVGDFLLAVDGKDVKADSEVYRAFEGTVGKRTTLKVGPSADGVGSKNVVVEPIGDESALRNRAWVEGNLRKVHERTNGRVAYVYVPNTADIGYSYFKRYFFPQVDKEAIIVDERFNGGGQVADYYIDLLKRPLVSYWATRYGETLRTPNAAIMGPKVMLTDETAGSGGDLLPWMFRKFKIGKLVGKRTWGGLVGILGFPELMDGGMVTAPDLAFFTEEGWGVENEGVAPDVEVEQDPAAVAAGKDPQLDRAISILMEELAKNPPPKAPARPRFPVKTHRSARVTSTEIKQKD